MEITKITIHNIEKSDSKLKGVASIVLCDALAIHGIKIIEGEKGLFIAMPARKLADQTFKDIVHPINADARKIIETSIIEEYKKS